MAKWKTTGNRQMKPFRYPQFLGTVCVAVGLCSSLLFAGCSPQQRPEEGAMAQQAEQLFGKLAKKPEIQEQFAAGRHEVMQKDQELRQRILSKTAQEQKWLLQNQTLGTRTLLEQLDARKKWLQQDEALRKSALKQNLQEQRWTLQEYPREVFSNNLEVQGAMAEQPEFLQKMMKQSLDMQDHILTSAATKERAMEDTLILMDAVAKDAAKRAIMAEDMLLIMHDPKLKAAMEQMIAQAVKKEMQKVQSQTQSQMQPTKKNAQQERTGAQRTPAATDSAHPAPSKPQQAELEAAPSLQ